MFSGTIAIFLGVLAFQFLPALPFPSGLLLIPVAGSALFAPRKRISPQIMTAVAGFCAGFLWAFGHAAVRLADVLPPELQGRDVELAGRVVDLPETEGRRIRFLFDVQTMTVDGDPHPSPGRVRLSWYGTHPRLHPGDRWRLTVRLKRPHGFMNPGGFDYERWLFGKGIRATGYVRERQRNERLAAGLSLDRVRDLLAGEIGTALGERPATALLQALAVGDRRGITGGQWEVLAATGTTHLMAISGLHIGLVAGLALLLVRRIWSRCAGCSLRWPAVRAGAVAGLMAAFFYAALAGFSVPTQRALVMTAIALAALLLDRPVLSPRTFVLALLAVIAIDPLAVLSWSFWLSFAAVALILYAAAGRLRAPGRLRRWVGMQWAVTLGLSPLLLVAFGEASWVAALVNLWAIPWVGLVVVPLTLAGTLLILPWPDAGERLLMLAADALDGCWWSLELAAGGSPLQALPPLWTLLPAGLGLALLLAPKGVPGRAVGLFGLLPLLLFAPARPGQGEAWVTVLDVGQGLAIVAETARHALVYDTGPRFSGSFNAGEAAVVPFLRSRGIGQLDALILSHGDEDHSGGFAAVAEAVPVTTILSSASEIGRPCLAGQRWVWDGVVFEILHPRSEQPRGNDASCVLRIASGAEAILLPGDIEAAAESDLVRWGAGTLRSDIVVAPHHGSRTSSSPEFVRATAPGWVIASTGYRNRFRFPHPEVASRYRGAGARLVETAAAGAVEIRLGGGEGIEVRGYRARAARYWNEEAALCQGASLC